MSWEIGTGESLEAHRSGRLAYLASSSKETLSQVEDEAWQSLTSDLHIVHAHSYR